MNDLLEKLNKKSQQNINEKYDNRMYEALFNIINNNPEIYIIKKLFSKFKPFQNMDTLIIESNSITDKIEIDFYNGSRINSYNRRITDKDSKTYYNLMTSETLNAVFSIIEDLRGDTIENISGGLLRYLTD
jgi:hypothetical protein